MVACRHKISSDGDDSPLPHPWSDRCAPAFSGQFALATANRAEAVRAAPVDFNERSLQAAIDDEYAELEVEDSTYERALLQLKQELDFGLPVQFVDRGFLPNFDFARFEAVVVVGQDGLVANAAKYVGDTPIVAVNPDPRRIDGILLPFQVSPVRFPRESPAPTIAGVERIVSRSHQSGGRRQSTPASPCRCVPFEHHGLETDPVLSRAALHGTFGIWSYSKAVEGLNGRRRAHFSVGRIQDHGPVRASGWSHCWSPRSK
jgi:hypothetical protein